MAEYSLYGKKRLCYTDILDYTDYQGIGKDPLYKRFDSVKSVIKRYIPSDFQHFLSQPIYDNSDDVINWYIEEWKDEPKRLAELSPADLERYESIKETTLKVYKECLHSLTGEDRALLAGALRYIHNDAIYCYDGKVVAVAWGMKPDTKRHVITGAVVHDFVVKKKIRITFEVSEHGRLKNLLDATLQREEGYEITKEDIPIVVPDKDFEMKGWNPSPIGYRITEETVFKAVLEPCPISNVVEPEPEIEIPIKEPINDEREEEDTDEEKEEENPAEENSEENKPEYVYVRFMSDARGSIVGNPYLKLLKGDSIKSTDLPEVRPVKEQKFVGWLPELPSSVYADMTFTAQYEEDIPWYKKLWSWLTSEKVLTWIKRLLMVLLLLLLLAVLFRACSSCSSDSADEFYYGAKPVEQIVTPDGKVIDDNNNRANESIIENDGKLPDNQSLVVAPIVDGDGAVPPIHQEPGKPDIIANRLNIYFEDESSDLQSFADAFKAIYQGDEYQIIGCDNRVRMIQIQIPEDKRNQIRDGLAKELPEFKFFIVDESLFRGYNRTESESQLSGWHLDAVRARQAWEITQGVKDVTVAIVDDGIDYTHPMFENKITKAYNVFTQDNRLSVGDGHGTHVAGLAVGSSNYIERGVAGIAPLCQLMPVQVFDNDYCTFSSVTSGIMYAVHEGADVVNISIGMTFQGLSEFPVDQQQILSRVLCQNEEKVWKKIISFANKKNCILVFAVGNDKILASIPPENRIGSSLNVAAVGPDLKAAQFSNFGDGANISAPGVNICSAFPGATFKSFDGTSMSAPIVSGAVALMRSVDRDINVHQVLNLLQKTGRRARSNVPPVIQIDRAIMGMKSGIKDGNLEDEGNRNSGNENLGNGNRNEGNRNSEANNHEAINEGTVPDTDNPGNTSHVNSKPEADYSSIRALIEEYKKKIKELEKQLPEHQQ